MDFRSGCPIASSLDLVGDRWSLVLLRSLIVGARSYSDLLAIPERISTNILADRLKKMTEFGLIVRQSRRRGNEQGIYLVTEKGAALMPVLQAFARWGHENIPDRWRTPDWFLEALPSDLAARQQKGDD